MLRKTDFPTMHAVFFSSLLVFATHCAAEGNEGSLVYGVKMHVTEWLLTDQKFVDIAAESGNAEVELAEIALQKSQAPKVRGLAQQVLDDHAVVSIELKSIAQGKELQIPLGVDLDHKDDLARLGELEGGAFDSAYIELMQKDRAKAVSLFTAAAESKKLDSRLQGFAKKTLPILQAHLQQAQLLRRTVLGEG